MPGVSLELFLEFSIADEVDMVGLQAEGAGTEADGFQDFFELLFGDFFLGVEGFGREAPLEVF